MKRVLLVLFLLLVSPSLSQAKTETVKIYGDLSDTTVATRPSSTWQESYNTSTAYLVYKDWEYAESLVRSNNNQEYVIYRSFFNFDTSGIPDDAVIKSANFNVYVYRVHNDGESQRAYMGLYQGTQDSIADISPQDITACGDSLENPTAGAESVGLQSIASNDYQKFSLTPSGISWISKIGFSSFCLRNGHDVENKAISGGPFTYSGIRMHSGNYPGTSTDPYLEIEYEILEPENKYPLYTQIESPYPSLLETAQWADDVYANGRGLLGEYPCGATIGECGCAITSLVMAARNVGIEEDVLDGDVNPGNMNEYLENVGGYDSVGSLYWLAAQVYFGTFREDGSVESRFATPVKRPVSESVMSFVNNALTDEKNAVLAYKNGHFVWVPEKTSDVYLVNDPWWYNTKTADDAFGDKVRDYNNTFDDARVFSIADEPVVLSSGAFEAHVRGTAELLFTKGTGEQVGYVDGGVVIDLEHASYDGTEVVSVNGTSQTDGKSLLVYDTGSEFTIEVVGTESGEFSAEFFAVSPSGEIQTFELSGETIPGVVTTFTINTETGEVTEEPLSYEQFLALLNTVLADYPKQQRAFFLQWARMMFDSMQDKSVTQALKKIEVYKKLLKAKKINSPILGGALDLLTEGLKKK